LVTPGRWLSIEVNDSLEIAGLPGREDIGRGPSLVRTDLERARGALLRRRGRSFALRAQEADGCQTARLPTREASGTLARVESPLSPILSPGQLEALAARGEERTAAEGEFLFRIGDAGYPLIVVLEGEAAVLDAAGNEIARQGPGGFLGELGLLTGQTVYVDGVVTKPMRYIALDREHLRPLLFEDGALSDMLLSTFTRRREILQRSEGVGFHVIGPRSSGATRDLLDYARRSGLPHVWRDIERADDPEAAALVAGLEETELPLVRLPGGTELRNPSHGQLWRALGIGLELGPREEVDVAVIGGGPAGLGAAVYAASEGLNTLVVESTVLGGQAGASRRIENYLGFPAGISGSELTSRAIGQARKFGARTASPYRALALESGNGTHRVQLDEGREIIAPAVVLATGAEYRRLAVPGLREYEGLSVFYAAGPPEARACGGTRVGIVGGGNSAGQAAVWLARGGALVTLLHRRADVRETMSSYLIPELERHGVTVRDRSEIAELHGEDGQLDGVTLRDGAHVCLRSLFCFLGADPHTEWLGDTVARDEHGFILTGADAGAAGLLETSVAGIYAAGDVRAGSTKRCATAVGEGAAVVGFVHERLGAVPA
jgi:thioredoxin reductase (NADPH)